MSPTIDNAYPGNDKAYETAEGTAFAVEEFIDDENSP